MLPQNNDILFQTFMGVKYIYTKGKVPIGYTKVSENIYKNDNVIPVLYGTSNIISDSDFKNLEYPNNISALLSGAVVKNEKSNISTDIAIKPYDLDYELVKTKNINVETKDDKTIIKSRDNGKIKLTDKVTISENASNMGGSQVYLNVGEVMSVDDLIKSICIASANDSAVALAEFIPGSEEKFVKMMNKKVRELGLKNTYFKNCTGLDEDGHYSSAYDMAMIARELVVNHSEILRFSSMYEDYLRENTDNKFWLVNTNKVVC